MMRKSALTIFLLLFLAANAYPHDLWVENRERQYLLMYGHIERPENYNPGWVRDVRGYDGRMKGLKLDVVKGKETISFSSKKPVALVSLVFDSGYWIKTTDGWMNRSKRGVTDYIEAGRYTEPVKTIFRWSKEFTRPVGTMIEIVPLRNPISLRPGERFPIKVLFEGAPVAGAVITSHGELTGLRTAKDGIAEVRIEERGLQVFAARHKVPLKGDPDADFQLFQAYISFEVR
jgi:nickel transport protein